MTMDVGGATGLEVAVVGMAGRFPGAGDGDLDAFWRNLRDGVESVTFFTPDQLAAAGVDPAVAASPHYVPAWARLDGIDLFDAGFFGYTPLEAALMDPQQRLFLECAWHALENAGYDPARTTQRIGVYAGTSNNTYAARHIWANPEFAASVGDFMINLGGEKDFVATRVAYKLNLQGPAVAIQTACSTSLVAIHLACQSLLAGDADVVLSGGVGVYVQQDTGYLYQEGGVVSPDGHCHVFDARARGTVGGTGVGVVVLRRLADALADGDTIHAVIRGSAINNDGFDKLGFTAPRVEGQARVIRAAQLTAEVEPDTIGYVEAHGTGTELGDPIEVEALTQAFRAGTDRVGFCALGSVKANVGHTDAAAGVAGLIKAALALRHAEIPPVAGFATPNPRIDFDRGPFYLPTEARPWPAGAHPRRAGVSCFGLGGTNAHAVLEEAPAPAPGTPSRPWQLLLLSARSRAALEAATDRLADHLEAHPEQELADVAFTLQTGRAEFAHRRVLVCRGHDDAVRALRARDPARVVTARVDGAPRRVSFLFPGGGAQYLGMARGVYEAEPTFRAELDRCAGLLLPLLGMDVRQLLFAADEARGQALNRPALMHPVLFAVEYGLARLWMEWGVRPHAMLGHSFGEYVAACLAGVFSLGDALALMVERGRLMEGVAPGAMTSVPLPEAELRPLLPAGVSLAAVNTPSACVASGPEERIAALEAALAARGVETRRVHFSHAAHSEMMEPIRAPYEAVVAGVTRGAPSLPFLSCSTGTWITPDEAADPAYWGRHLRHTVRFSDGAAALLADGDAVLLEVGPGRTLGNLVQRHPARAAGHAVLASTRHPSEEADDEATLLATLGRLWLAGVPVRWAGFYRHESRRRVPLPGYPFERKRYWIERPAGTAAAPAPASIFASVSPGPPAGAADAADGDAGEPAADEEPRTETERRVAEVLRTFLGVERVGVHDSFFELGGDSLVATQVVSRLRDDFAVELRLGDFFASPTVAGFAEVVEAAEGAALLEMMEGGEELTEEELRLLAGLAEEEASHA